MADQPLRQLDLMPYFVSVRKTKDKNRGVFAEKDFSKGEIIEQCPIIHLSAKEYRGCSKTILDFYFYEWKTTRDAAVVLGYGWIYNHSYTPNATYNRNFKKHLMVYKAIKPIKKGQEITVNYQGHPHSRKPINWFKVINS